MMQIGLRGGCGISEGGGCARASRGWSQEGHVGRQVQHLNGSMHLLLEFRDAMHIRHSRGTFLRGKHEG